MGAWEADPLLLAPGKHIHAGFQKYAIIPIVISQSPTAILSSGALRTVFKSYKRSGRIPEAEADT